MQTNQTFISIFNIGEHLPAKLIVKYFLIIISYLFQWELVCDKAYIAPLVTTVYFCGVMLGGVIFGGLSDRYGRKWMMLFCLYSQCLIGIGLHFVQRLPVFMGLRFVQGIMIQVRNSKFITIIRN